MRSKHGGYYITGHLRQVTSLPNEVNTIVFKSEFLKSGKETSGFTLQTMGRPSRKLTTENTDRKMMLARRGCICGKTSVRALSTHSTMEN